MKSLNAKRIAAIVTGAALLGAGLAFAGPLTFQNVPIISSSGQPVVQVVIGSSAKPSDGVAAGNIAAAIGNLAYTSTAVVPIINTTLAKSLLSVSVSSAHYSLTNQQVWLNETGSVGGSTGSSYIFSALIGSVLNQGVQLGSPQYTKGLQTGTTYSFVRGSSTSQTPSPYYSTTLSTPPTGGTTPSTSNNNAANTGGGVTFSTFTSAGYDNILQVTNAQFSSLANNWGSNGETESLFLTGFPVYDQANSGAIQNKFALLSSGGAYVATFGKSIPNRPSGGGTGNINVPIRILGQNYTIINGTGSTTAVTGSSQVNGGKIALASSIAPLQTVYVGHNVTSGPWTVQLQDLAQTTNGLNAPAAVAVYYNGVLTNETTVNTTKSTKINVSSHILFVNVQQTFAGLYAYQKWAKIQLYAGVYNLQDGKVFNQTNDPGWIVNLFWTNSTGGTNASSLRSIVIYNSTPTSLVAGQSFSFIQNPSTFKLTFLGDTLGNNYDALTTTLSSAATGQYYYTNSGAGANSHGNPSNITEPAQLLTVTSGINNAFSYGGQTGSQLTYVLTPYSLAYTANGYSAGTAGFANVLVLSYNNNAGTSGNFVNANAILTVSVSGFTSNTAGSATTLPNIQFTAASQTQPLTQALYNITAITIQNGRALPLATGGSFSITAENAVLANALSTLTEGTTPLILLKEASGQTYNQTLYSGGNTILYNQQNGQQTNIYVLTGTGAKSGSVYQYYTFNVLEEPVPQNTIALDSLGFGIYNTTGSQTQSQLLQMNYSQNGQHNNATYISTQGYTFPVQVGFRTEKGSTVASISPTSDTFDMATSVDQLQFALTTTAGNVVVSKSSKTVGPYSVGQATNLPNVSIAAVNASIGLSSGKSNYTILGLGNLTAAISTNPSMATTPVWLTNLSSTAPLVVLDSDASSGSSLILVGSGYVNSLSQQLESAYNVQVSPTSAPIVQAYGGNRILVAGYYANQTTAAANSFISQLYSAAASST